MQHVYFSEHVIALSQEVLLHPDLQLELSKHPEDDWPVRLGRIAEYVGIVLDDVYKTDEELDILCEAICMKLLDKRSILVLPK